MTLEQLAKMHCQPRKGTEHALAPPQLRDHLAALPGWEPEADGKAIRKDFRFPDFHRTLGFVNAIGYMANREDHHPDLEVGYGHCLVRWSTHEVGGLSLNDMICAARVEAIVAG